MGSQATKKEEKYIDIEDLLKESLSDKNVTGDKEDMVLEYLCQTISKTDSYDALHGEKKDYFSKAFQIPEGYSFQIALAVGHKTDHKTPHEYDFDKQVTIL